MGLLFHRPPFKTEWAFPKQTFQKPLGTEQISFELYLSRCNCPDLVSDLRGVRPGPRLEDVEYPHGTTTRAAFWNFPNL